MSVEVIAGKDDFNSQPHKEADLQSYDPDLGDDISTHSLTRRLTYLDQEEMKEDVHFNSQPHKEADNVLVSSLHDCEYFNSQPHKEADPVPSRQDFQF